MSRTREDVADEALVRSLFADHGRAMLAYARQLTSDHAAAEDIVQEALVRAWRHSASLDEGKGSVRGWLLTVVRNIAYDRSRARKSRPFEVAENAFDAAVAADHADRVLDSIIVVDALDRLSVEHRQVLERVYLHGSTVSEAADELGIPPGTVKSRTYYAIRVLRAILYGHLARLEGTS